MVQKIVKGTQNLLDVKKAKKILLYTSMYLQHGFRLTAVHQLVECEQGKPFSWFPEEVANTRCERDKDSLRKSWVTLRN